MATQSQFGAFLPTTDVFDVMTSDQNIDPKSDDFKLFLVRLRQSQNNSALITNIKDSGYYLPAEFVNGQLYFPNPDPLVTDPARKTATYRQVYRIVVDFGALPNAATKSVAHGITDISDQFTFTRMYATASDPVGFIYLPIPNMTALGQIYMSADATNVNITTTFNAAAFTRCFVVLEYIKD